MSNPMPLGPTDVDLNAVGKILAERGVCSYLNGNAHNEAWLFVGVNVTDGAGVTSSSVVVGPGRWTGDGTAAADRDAGLAIRPGSPRSPHGWIFPGSAAPDSVASAILEALHTFDPAGFDRDHVLRWLSGRSNHCNRITDLPMYPDGWDGLEEDTTSYLRNVSQMLRAAFYDDVVPVPAAVEQVTVRRIIDDSRPHTGDVECIELSVHTTDGLRLTSSLFDAATLRHAAARSGVVGAVNILAEMVRALHHTVSSANAAIFAAATKIADDA